MGKRNGTINLIAAVICAAGLGSDIVLKHWGWVIVQAIFVAGNVAIVISYLRKDA